MRLTSWNFLHAQVLAPSGADAESPLEFCLKEIATDLLALQEVDFHLPRTDSTNQSADVAAACAAQWWAFAPTVSGTPGEDWKALDHKKQIVVTAENASSFPGSYGISIISKIPVQHWLRHELGRSRIGMPLAIAGEKGQLRLLYVRDEPRVALAAVLENGWTVINVHLSFVPLFNIFQLWKVSRWAKFIEKKYASRVIIVGDLNLPWSIPTQVTRWSRATSALTYPSWNPKISFDYILTRKFDKTLTKEVSFKQLPVSDHRPIAIEID